MTERELRKELKIGTFRPYLYCQYKSVIKGFNHTDYLSERNYKEFAGPKLTVISNTCGTPKVIDKEGLDRALKQMIWLDDGQLKLFWKLKPSRDCDFVIREVQVSTIYHYGRDLYLKSSFGNKEVKVDQIGFGYDYFTIHYLKKADLAIAHGVKDYGDLTKSKLTKYLSQKRDIY